MNSLQITIATSITNNKNVSRKALPQLWGDTNRTP
jgi:hypothetical protein